MSSIKRRSASVLKNVRTFRASRQTTVDTIEAFLSSLDTPKSLAIWILFSNDEHAQMLDIACDPKDYSSPERFRLDLAAVSFLSKAVFLKTGYDLKQVAFTKFLQYEELCQETNRRFKNPVLDPLNHGSNVWLLNAVKRKISEILGPFSGEEFVSRCGWGPGVSTLIKGEEVSAYNKFHAERGITRDLYAFVSDWFPAAYPLWSQHLTHESGAGWCDYQVGNVIVTVPKNSKTDRVIAIEPGINLWFQKGIGSMIRRRLLRTGIDLTDQTRNQRLSKIGSLTGLLSTVDFSSASDSISLELVREVLPHDWFQVLNLCRSPLGKLDSEIIRWEKFSSMGNGFTFELESLIFYAAAKAVTEYLAQDGEISVFGDDVIIPSTCYSLFSDFSKFLGFRVNDKKSFSSGYFRESCGSYYYRGMDCKPLFLKERIGNVESIYKLANGLRLLSHRFGSYRSCDDRFRDLWQYLLHRVPEPLRLKVPLVAGDTGFIVNFDEACPVRAKNGIEGYHFMALASIGLTRYTDNSALVLAKLGRSIQLNDISHWVRDRTKSRVSSFHVRDLALSEKRIKHLDRSEGNEYPLRGRVRKTLIRSLVSQWYNLGEWA